MGTRVGDICIKELLGASSFDITYRVDDDALGRMVVLREFFPTALSVRMADGGVRPVPGQQEAFDRERQSFSGAFNARTLIHHPNVARVFRLMQGRGTDYAVVE